MRFLRRPAEQAFRVPGPAPGIPHRRVVVLAYHGVHPGAGAGHTEPDLFRRHLAWLDSTCRIVRFEDVLRESRTGPAERPRVALTFDDGLASAHERVLPLLAERSLPGTFFLTTGLVDADETIVRRYGRFSGLPRVELRGMSWSEVRELCEAGMAIGAHTVTHPNLASLGGEEAREEILRSKRVIEDRLGREVTLFAYPFGKPKHHFNRLTMKLVEDSGYSFAGAIHFRGVRPGDAALAIPRFAIGEDDVEELARKVRGDRDGVGRWQQTAPRWLSHAISPQNSHRDVGSLLDPERSSGLGPEDPERDSLVGGRNRPDAREPGAPARAGPGPGRRRDGREMREPGAGLSSAVAEALSVTGGLLPGAAEADIPFFAYANASSSVWLLPTDAADRRAALSLYAPQKLRGRALRGAMRRGILSRRTTLDADRVTDLREEIERALATRVRALAFYIGPPNLSRKCTICVIGPERTPIAFAKLAALPQARSMIRNERAVLRQLSEVPGLLDRIPAVLGTITWSDSEAILLAPGPTRAAPSRFGELHEEFLLRLHEASERTGDLLVSPAWMEAERTQDRLVPLLPPAWIDRYARAFEQVRARLGGVSMRLVRAHRDFAPWNMRVGRRGLFVFDWESSREGLPGLFDVFQYSTVPAALMNRPAVRPWASRHRRREGDPVGSPDPEELWLPFLVDLSLEYAAAAAEYPYRGKERVREWFGREIDRALADP